MGLLVLQPGVVKTVPRIRNKQSKLPSTRPPESSLELTNRSQSRKKWTSSNRDISRGNFRTKTSGEGQGKPPFSQGTGKEEVCLVQKFIISHSREGRISYYLDPTVSLR